MFPYGYVPRGAQPSEPKVYVTPETPGEQRIVDAARKRGWSGNGSGELRFRREGAQDVVVTRDALRRIPALEDTIVRQLERG
jgi:hypothetical protein